MAGKREEQMREITERLEQGVKELFTSEMYTEYLKAMSQFHNYSFNNTVLIAMQKPDATLVAGYQAWQKKFNRHVKRGEKAIQIIAPVPIRGKQEMEKIDPDTQEPILRPDGQPETEEVEIVIPRFRVTSVFDISQTEGDPIPELATPELMGSVKNFQIFMQAIREVSPVPIRADNIESGAKGYYSNTEKEIVIQVRMSESQTMKTAVHEVTHAMLHDRDLMEELGEKKGQMTREVEAESVAYTVCQYFGLDTSDYSFPYIAGWSSDRDMKELRTSMDTIRKTAGSFIDDMVEKIQQLQSELSIMQQAELLIDAAEARGISFTDEEKNLIVNYAFKLDNIEDTEILTQELAAAMHDPDVRSAYQVRMAAQAEIDALPDGMVGLSEMHQYGYRNDAMLPVTNERAHELYQAGLEIFRLYPDGTEAALDAEGEMDAHEGMFGIEKEAWEKHRNLALVNEGQEMDEAQILTGTENSYAIYQIESSGKGREYEFMGMDFVTSHKLEVDGADYNFVYGGRLSEGETLDSIYEKFNLNHPENYTGHSLSVSDVVFLRKENEAKAYYVDSFGFQELPDFVRQRLNEAEINPKREDSQITADTAGVEIEQHEGLWHTVDQMEIQGETFYLMQHNEYGDSVSGVIVNAGGKLVAQDLEKGFDRGALEAIQEYLAEKGISWEPETTGEKIYPPLYPHTLDYAVEHGAADDYLDSRSLNIACKKAVEEAISHNFDGMHLANDVVDPVLEEYGKERLAYILACTLQYKSWDGRFSIGNKAWAESIPVGENINRGVDANMDYVVESHPAVLDGFVNFARMRFEELEQTQETSIPQQSAEKNLESYDREIAYRIEATGQYLAVQTATDGVDYTFYDKDFREIDGGIYDNPDISMEEAIGELLADEGLSMEDCHEIDYDDLLEKAEAVEQAEIQKLREQKEISQISDRTNPEAALNGQSCAGIEETILCYAQAQIDEMGLSEEVKLIGARVYGSRTRKDLFTEESDIDVVLSYSGDMREDTFFNLLHEEKFQIAGIPVDINPISPEKTGTLEEFMEKAEQYLDMKEAEIASRRLSESLENEQRDETKISFYVAECMEFTVMGEYHDNLTLEEAVELYDKIPADRMHGGKGIGFCLEDGSIYDGEFELMSGGKVLKDIINEIPHYKDSPLVQKAITDLEAILEARNEKQIGQTAELEKPEKTAPEPEKRTPEGTGKKQSVLNALRERQAKLKAQEQNQPAEKTPGHKKGEQEL